jgi:hypothetical protein
MGNHDEGFLYKRFLNGSSYASLKAHDLLSEQDLEFFKQNKDGTYGDQFIIDQKNRLLLVHGGPVNPKKITKNGNDPWLCQRTWQRLSEEGNEFYSYYGYHYNPTSAFDEGKTHLDNFIILCGHQHIEAAIKQDKEQITNIWSFKHKTEKIGTHVLRKHEFPIEQKSNYLFRVGLGGPQGDYKGEATKACFGIVQHDPKKVTLFRIE